MRSVTVFGSWVVTLGFFFGVFLFGKYLQHRERQEKITKKLNDALRRDFVQSAMQGRSVFYGAGYTVDPTVSTLGTRYGEPITYERRQAGTR
ncbi:MAG TPA: hypothetical protein VGS27_36540 [Candidatus Sulfotelmatobacter sp.]|nr:hypothetical protein [Candidatus Sulfotelmatobacter sp.]